MTNRTFAMYAKLFDGIATIGECNTADGVVTVYVHPAPGQSLPSVDRINRAIAIGDDVEERLGVTVIVKTADPAMPALPA